MAFDETLAERIRDHLAPRADIEEKKMFGGIAFLTSGKMGVGVSGDSLMVRVGKDDYEKTTSEQGVGEFGKTGRPMTGWVLVSPEQIDKPESLARWADRGIGYADSLDEYK